MRALPFKFYCTKKSKRHKRWCQLMGQYSLLKMLYIHNSKKSLYSTMFQQCMLFSCKSVRVKLTLLGQYFDFATSKPKVLHSHL